MSSAPNLAATYVAVRCVKAPGVEPLRPQRADVVKAVPAHFDARSERTIARRERAMREHASNLPKLNRRTPTAT